jgi:hypothetical protein
MLQVIQEITPDNRVARKEFSMTMLEKLDEDKEFQRKIMFSDEATFHVSGKVNKQNVSIWGQNTLTLQCSTLERTPKLMCACCTIVFFGPKRQCSSAVT